jgi:hypothetical protein
LFATSLHNRRKCGVSAFSSWRGASSGCHGIRNFLHWRRGCLFDGATIDGSKHPIVPNCLWVRANGKHSERDHRKQTSPRAHSDTTAAEKTRDPCDWDAGPPFPIGHSLRGLTGASLTGASAGSSLLECQERFRTTQLDRRLRGGETARTMSFRQCRVRLQL